MQAAHVQVSGLNQWDEVDDINKMRDERADEMEKEDEMKTKGTEKKMEGLCQLSNSCSCLASCCSITSQQEAKLLPADSGIDLCKFKLFKFSCSNSPCFDTIRNGAHTSAFRSSSRTVWPSVVLKLHTCPKKLAVLSFFGPAIMRVRARPSCKRCQASRTTGCKWGVRHTVASPRSSAVVSWIEAHLCM